MRDKTKINLLLAALIAVSAASAGVRYVEHGKRQELQARIDNQSELVMDLGGKLAAASEEMNVQLGMGYVQADAIEHLLNQACSLETAVGKAETGD